MSSEEKSQDEIEKSQQEEIRRQWEEELIQKYGQKWFDENRAFLDDQWAYILELGL